jgi:hypothetical protein
VYDLRLSEEAFGRITPVLFAQLLERHAQAQRGAMLRAGLVAAAVINSQGGIKGRAVTPQEMIGEEEPMQDISAFIGLLEANGVELERGEAEVEG